MLIDTDRNLIAEKQEVQQISGCFVGGKSETELCSLVINL